MSEYVSRYIRINDEIKQKIIVLSEKNLTGSEIAAQLGITRNSVIGFLYRSKQKKELIGEHQEKKLKEKKPKKKITLAKIKIPKVQIEEPVMALPEEPEAAYMNLGEELCTIDGLRFSSCRFIVEQGNHETTKYCGKMISKQSYCKDHYKLCYYPSKYTLKSLLNDVSK